MSLSGGQLIKADLRELRTHVRDDLVAGFSVALVALPLSLGIAMGAGAPPISGVLSAMVGGLLTTFLRGSYVAINGPGNSLIVILATALAAFGGGAQAFAHVLGVVVVSGSIQVLLGLIRAGKLAEATPVAVIQGLLSAIGIIIIAKQLHVVFGGEATATNPIDVFAQLPQTVVALNPFVALIGVSSVLILVVHPRIDNKLVRFVPAPLWVVLVAIPMVELFNFLQPHTLHLFGRTYHVGPELLVSIPDDLRESMVRPNFSRIGEVPFWTSVALVTLVTSIENVVSVKAIDKLDPGKRASNLDRDLGAVGLSTIIAGLLGGLPVLTVVARSSVNVNHGAKTSWSNFFHGAFLFVFVIALSPLIQEIPLAALAGILVYTGYRLTSPKVFKAVLDKGPDHFVIFAITLGATLAWGLLWGVLIGVVAELISQLIVLQLPIRDSFARIRRSRFEAVDDEEEEQTALLRVDGVANFPNVGRLRAALGKAPERKHLIVDFSRALLVDTTLLEYCREFAGRHSRADPERRVDVIGLEAHHAFSGHPEALRVLNRPLRELRLTPRQRQIQELAQRQGWAFDARRDWTPRGLYGFQFFRAHPLEYRDTTVDGEFGINGATIPWRLCDVTFDEGKLLPQVYHTTALVLWPPVELPRFMLERRSRLERGVKPAAFRTVRLDSRDFRRMYTLKSPDPAAARGLMDPELVDFLSASQSRYHLESDGRGLLIFSVLRLSSVPEVERMLDFGGRLALLLEQKRRRA